MAFNLSRGNDIDVTKELKDWVKGQDIQTLKALTHDEITEMAEEKINVIIEDEVFSRAEDICCNVMKSIQKRLAKSKVKEAVIVKAIAKDIDKAKKTVGKVSRRSR